MQVLKLKSKPFWRGITAGITCICDVELKKNLEQTPEIKHHKIDRQLYQQETSNFINAANGVCVMVLLSYPRLRYSKGG